jgi:hypothetical protein
VTAVRDDRILAYTRGLSLAIVPFLVVGFLVLYPVPTDTQQWFAWTIHPTMTPMILASAYLGGAFFFVCVVREQMWHTVKIGFLAVALFASLLGIATIVHWDKFNHGFVAFWIWAALYFLAPFLVLAAWLVNRRYEAPPQPDDVRLPDVARGVIAVVGLLALVTGLMLFLAPTTAIGIWPWLLTPLTCRVVGAIYCLGCALLIVVPDPRWTTFRLMLQVEMVMVTLIVIAAVRAHGEFYTDRPITWLMLGGFVGVLLGSVYLWYWMEIRPRGGRSAPAQA